MPFVRIMPVVQREPLEAEDGDVEEKTKHARDEGGGKERGELGLAVEDDRREAEATAVPGGGAGIHVGDDGANRGERGGDAEAGEKVGQRTGHPQMKQLLPATRAI